MNFRMDFWTAAKQITFFTLSLYLSISFALVLAQFGIDNGQKIEAPFLGEYYTLLMRM